MRFPFGIDASRNTGIDWDNTICLDAMTYFGKPQLFVQTLEDLRRTHGSTSTMFVPSGKRLKYLPRTPPFIDAKSYSGRSSSLRLLLVFFIEFPLTPRNRSGADDANCLALFRVRYDKHPPRG